MCASWWGEASLPVVVRGVVSFLSRTLFDFFLLGLILGLVLHVTLSLRASFFFWKMADEGLSFTKQMRKATKEVHDLSNALVTAKLGLGKFKFSLFSLWWI